MSKEYFNVVCPRNGKDGKTEWHRVGVAFKNDAKPDIPFNIILSSTPIPDINEKGKLECRLMIMKPKDYQGSNNNQQASSPPQNTNMGGNMIDDDITF